MKKTNLFKTNDNYQSSLEIIYEDGKFIGETLNGIPNGFGKYWFTNGDYYEGNFVDGLFEGKGYLYIANDNTKYSGQFYDGEPSGIGKIIFPDLSVYEGSIDEGKPYGYGILYEYNQYHNEFPYKLDGEWVYGKKDGIFERYIKKDNVYQLFSFDIYEEDQFKIRMYVAALKQKGINTKEEALHYYLKSNI